MQGDAPLPPKTQKYLNALHTSNLLLQKRTKAYFLVVNSDDQPLQAQEEAQTGGDEKAPRSPSRLLWKKVQEKYVACKWQAVIQQSSAGQKCRTELIRKCREEPEFMLDFGPVGDLPLHLAFLFGKGRLGLDMIEAVESSKAYWDRCRELIEEWGQDKM